MAAAGRIQRLDETVVNRIAAGEVVHRPASALKELLENSLDAGATAITVTAKAGGMKLLQIQDDGHGIREADLPIVCERFTTSKLRTFEELQQGVPTYGFRGEALASITHVAHVTITTKTAEQQCAFKAKYADGRLAPLAPGQPAQPKRCAGVTGTTITVEDLFFNMPTRRGALKNSSEQYARILDVVTRYAVHCGGRGIAFTCRKFRESSADFSAAARNSTLDTIRAAYGPSIARELSPVEGGCEPLRLAFRGFVSSANFSLKKGVFILFINNRLVESAALKRTVEGVYSELLPKGTHPFVYLAIELPPDTVDVNVHPTKREVHFLHEEALHEAVEAAVREKLAGANESRTFEARSLAGTSLGAEDAAGASLGAEEAEDDDGEDEEHEQEERPAKRAKRKPKPKAATQTVDLSQPKRQAKAHDPRKLVRTDARDISLEAYLLPSQSQAQAQAQGQDQDQDQAQPQAQPQPQQWRPQPQSAVNLASVGNMRRDVEARAHDGLAQLLREHSFVGTANDARSLVQHRTKLYLVSHTQLCRELFYQAAVRQWAALPSVALQPAPEVRALARLALDVPEARWTPEDGDKDALAAEIALLLAEKAPMLAEYLSLRFEGEGEALRLTTLPVLVPGHTPELVALPMFVLRLATEVTWTEEQPCFESLAAELALFYARLPVSPAAAGGVEPDALHPAQGVLQHVLFPAMRAAMRPPRELTQDKSIMEVACLTKLYRIFERC